MTAGNPCLWVHKNGTVHTYVVWILLDELAPRADGKAYCEQIVHVQDRPGHDLRYAINADKIKLTGKKMTDRIYYSYTGYPGGQREATPASILAKPNGADRLIRKVVKGMLPKNKLADRLITNLYVYEGAEHKQAAQNPKSIDINLYK